MLKNAIYFGLGFLVYWLFDTCKCLNGTSEEETTETETETEQTGTETSSKTVIENESNFTFNEWLEEKGIEQICEEC